MKYLVFIFSIILISCGHDPAKTESSGTDSIAEVKTDTGEKKYEMKTYWLVFLKKGEKRNQDTAASKRIQAAHLANIDRLATEGKIIMAGPMAYDKDLRGIFIMDAKDSTEAASYIKTDSAIITGRLRFEIHPWWTAKGTYVFK